MMGSDRRSTRKGHGESRSRVREFELLAAQAFALGVPLLLSRHQLRAEEPGASLLRQMPVIASPVGKVRTCTRLRCASAGVTHGQAPSVGVH